MIIAHHTCSLENTFSAKLLMHMFFAGFALHLLVIVAAYVSPDLTDKPEQCTALGILIHYFLLAHFCWIFVQVFISLHPVHSQINNSSDLLNILLLLLLLLFLLILLLL